MTRFWKCYAIKSVSISPGRQVRIVTKTGWHIFNEDDLQYHASQTFTPFMTHYVFYRFHGAIAHDATDNTQVGYNDCKLDRACHFQYSHSLVNGNDIKRYVHTNNVDTVVNAEVAMPQDPAIEN